MRRFIWLWILGLLVAGRAEAAGGDFFARLRADDGPIAGRFSVYAYLLDSLDVAVPSPGPGRVLLLHFREANGDNSFIVPGDLAVKDRRGRAWTRGFASLEEKRLAGFIGKDEGRWAVWWIPGDRDSLEWSIPADLTLWYGFTKASFAPLKPEDARAVEAAAPWERLRAVAIEPERSVADLGDVVDPAAFDVPPLIVERVNPVYPKSARLYDFRGTVIVVAVVDERGEVADVFVLESSATHDLNASALAAVNRWKFKAGTKDGREARGGLVIPVSFGRSSGE